MTPKTKYFSEDSSGYPAYTGPEEFRVLGVWITGDVQLSPHTVLDMVDVIHGVSTGRVEAPQELSGNAFYVEADRDIVSVQNEFVEHVADEFTPREVLDALLDFWQYCTLVVPDRVTEDHATYLEEHGRDPLTAFE